MANNIQNSKKGIEMNKTKALTEAQIEQVDRDLEALLANKKELEAKLESEKKPELRHGEYGHDYNDGATWIKLGGSVYWISDGEMGKSTLGNRSFIDHPSYKYGNIFDDLKDMQEDVTEFEILQDEGLTETRVWLDNGYLKMKQDSERVYIELESSPDFFKKLRQMEAIMQRSEK